MVKNFDLMKADEAKMKISDDMSVVQSHNIQSFDYCFADEAKLKNSDDDIKMENSDSMPVVPFKYMQNSNLPSVDEIKMKYSDDVSFVPSNNIQIFDLCLAEEAKMKNSDDMSVVQSNNVQNSDLFSADKIKKKNSDDTSVVPSNNIQNFDHPLISTSSKFENSDLSLSYKHIKTPTIMFVNKFSPIKNYDISYAGESSKKNFNQPLTDGLKNIFDICCESEGAQNPYQESGETSREEQISDPPLENEISKKEYSEHLLAGKSIEIAVENSFHAAHDKQTESTKKRNFDSHSLQFQTPQQETVMSDPMIAVKAQKEPKFLTTAGFKDSRVVSRKCLKYVAKKKSDHMIYCKNFEMEVGSSPKSVNISRSAARLDKQVDNVSTCELRFEATKIFVEPEIIDLTDHAIKAAGMFKKCDWQEIRQEGKAKHGELQGFQYGDEPGDKKQNLAPSPSGDDTIVYNSVINLDSPSDASINEIQPVHEAAVESRIESVIDLPTEMENGWLSETDNESLTESPVDSAARLQTKIKFKNFLRILGKQLYGNESLYESLFETENDDNQSTIDDLELADAEKEDNIAIEDTTAVNNNASVNDISSDPTKTTEDNQISGSFSPVDDNNISDASVGATNQVINQGKSEMNSSTTVDPADKSTAECSSINFSQISCSNIRQYQGAKAQNNPSMQDMRASPVSMETGTHKGRNYRSTVYSNVTLYGGTSMQNFLSLREVPVNKRRAERQQNSNSAVPVSNLPSAENKGPSPCVGEALCRSEPDSTPLSGGNVYYNSATEKRKKFQAKKKLHQDRYEIMHHSSYARLFMRQLGVTEKQAAEQEANSSSLLLENIAEEPSGMQQDPISSDDNIFSRQFSETVYNSQSKINDQCNKSNAIQVTRPESLKEVMTKAIGNSYPKSSVSLELRNLDYSSSIMHQDGQEGSAMDVHSENFEDLQSDVEIVAEIQRKHAANFLPRRIEDVHEKSIEGTQKCIEDVREKRIGDIQEKPDENVQEVIEDIQKKPIEDAHMKLIEYIWGKATEDVQEKHIEDVQVKVVGVIQEKSIKDQQEVVIADLHEKSNTDVQEELIEDVQEELIEDVQEELIDDLLKKLITDTQEKRTVDVQEKFVNLQEKLVEDFHPKSIENCKLSNPFEDMQPRPYQNEPATQCMQPNRNEIRLLETLEDTQPNYVEYLRQNPMEVVPLEPNGNVQPKCSDDFLQLQSTAVCSQTQPFDDVEMEPIDDILSMYDEYMPPQYVINGKGSQNINEQPNYIGGIQMEINKGLQEGINQHPLLETINHMQINAGSDMTDMAEDVELEIIREIRPNNTANVPLGNGFQMLLDSYYPVASQTAASSSGNLSHGSSYVDIAGQKGRKNSRKQTYSTQSTCCASSGEYMSVRKSKELRKNQKILMRYKRCIEEFRILLPELRNVMDETLVLEGAVSEMKKLKKSIKKKKKKKCVREKAQTDGITSTTENNCNPTEEIIND